MEVRTSKSHPMRVDWLEGLPEGWRVGLTFGPGKTSRSLEGFWWERTLGEDLDVLRDQYHIDVVVCLMERDELSTVRMGNLQDGVLERGMIFVHFPIPDVQPPPSDEDVRALLVRLKHMSDSGKAIMIHCLGGVGRTGTIAGCLLRTLGHSGEEALHLVRKARGHRAPETEAQKEYVRRFETC